MYVYKKNLHESKSVSLTFPFYSVLAVCVVPANTGIQTATADQVTQILLQIQKAQNSVYPECLLLPYSISHAVNPTLLRGARSIHPSSANSPSPLCTDTAKTDPTVARENFSSPASINEISSLYVSTIISRKMCSMRRRPRATVSNGLIILLVWIFLSPTLQVFSKWSVMQSPICNPPL